MTEMTIPDCSPCFSSAYVHLDSNTLILVISTAIIMYVRMVSILWGSFIRFTNDIHENQVESLSGRVILDTDQNRRNFTLTIDQEKFKLSRKVYLRFKHLDTYTIYYAPRTRIILSAEPVEI